MALTNAGVDAILAEIVADYPYIASLTRTGDVSTLSNTSRAFLVTAVFEDTFPYKTRDVDVSVMLCEDRHFRANDTGRIGLKAAIALATYKQYRFNGVPSILNLTGSLDITPNTKSLQVGAMPNGVDTLNDVYLSASSYWSTEPTVGVLLVEEFLTGTTKRLFTRIDTLMKQGLGQAWQAALLADSNGGYPQTSLSFYDLTDADANINAFGDGYASVTVQGVARTKTEWLGTVRKAFLALSKVGGFSSYQ